MSNPLDPATLGILLLFGSAFGGAALGALVGWRTRFEWGAAVGLLCLAAGGFTGAVRLAWFVYTQSAVVEQARPLRCEEVKLHEGRGGTIRFEHFSAAAAGGGPLDLKLPFVTGRCDDAGERAPRRLRYALADAAGASGPVHAEPEDDPRQPWAMTGVLAAFGGFGLLAGLFFIAQSLPQRPLRAELGPLPPWRRSIGRGLVVAGNLSMIGGMAWAALANVSTERSLVMAFGAAALACAEFTAAFALLGRLRLTALLALAIVGGGCGLAAFAVRALA